MTPQPKEHLPRVTRRLDATRAIFADASRAKPRTVWEVIERLKPHGFTISRGQVQRDLKELGVSLTGY